MVKEKADHQPVVIFTKYNMDADKPFLVVNLPPARFIGVPNSQIRTYSIHGAYYPEISVHLIAMVGVPVEEALAVIVVKSIKVVIHMECYGESSWVNYLGEVWPTQSVDQWVY